MNSFNVTEDLIGKYLNRYMIADVSPVGKIIAIKGKRTVIVQPVFATKNKTKMEFVAGGFAGHCVNQDEQSYDFIEAGSPYELSLSATSMRNKSLEISDRPRKFYAFNF